VGEFRTDPVPPPPPPTDVRVTWERMHVTHDGDVGAAGKGEIRPSWGIPGETLGWFHRDKIDAGTSVALNGHTWVSVAEGEALPRLVFNISEADFLGMDSHGCKTAMATTHANQHYSAHCLERINVAMLDRPSLDFIRALPSCEGYGLPADKDDDHCIVLHTWDAHDNYAQADVLMSFRIAD
jgi:hypothetical protein